MRHTTMLELNEFLVLDFIRERTPTSRPEIARELGLSQASVSRIVKRLLRNGTLVETADTTDTPGRPANRITFNGRAGAVIAIDLGGTKCHGALADLSGTVLLEDVRPTRSHGTPYDTLVAVIDGLEVEAARNSITVSAVAIGVPAIVHPTTGIAIEGPNVEWTRFALVDQLRDRLDVPFTVDNDVKLAAIAEAWRGAGRNLRDFVTISIGTGIGAAVVMNGELLRGQNNAAGEIGYLVMNRDQLASERDDRLGGFESLASGPAIARRAHALLRDRPSTRSSLRSGDVTAETVFAGAAAGDPIARTVIGEVLDHVAIALIAVIGVVDPSRIILDGGVGRSLAPYLSQLTDRVAPLVPSVPEIVVSQLGPNGTVVGAIAAALRLVRERSTSAAVLETLNVETVLAHG